MNAPLIFMVLFLSSSPSVVGTYPVMELCEADQTNMLKGEAILKRRERPIEINSRPMCIEVPYSKGKACLTVLSTHGADQETKTFREAFRDCQEILDGLKW